MGDHFLFLPSGNLETTVEVSGAELIVNSEEKNKVDLVEVGDGFVRIGYGRGGISPSIINFKKIKSEVIAGSSINIPNTLGAVKDNKDITIAIPIAKDAIGTKVADLLKETAYNIIPIKADVSANTVVFVHRSHPDSVLYMHKPNIFTPKLEDFDKKWDLIMATSLPANASILGMVLEIFKASPEALKVVIPSNDLLKKKEDIQVQRLFSEILEFTDIVQVNSNEARTFLGIEHGVALSGKNLIERMVLNRNLSKVRFIIITMSEDGAVVGLRGSGCCKFFYVNRFKPKRAKSGTGCGDAHGGFFAVRLFESGGINSSLIDIKKALIWGARIGSLVYEVYPGNLRGTDKELTPEKLKEISNEISGLENTDFVQEL